MLEEFYVNNGCEELNKQLLLFPYDNRTGKDKSDILRGQIIGVRGVFGFMEEIERYEENQKKLRDIEEKMRKTAS